MHHEVLYGKLYSKHIIIVTNVLQQKHNSYCVLCNKPSYVSCIHLGSRRGMLYTTRTTTHCIQAYNNIEDAIQRYSRQYLKRWRLKRRAVSVALFPRCPRERGRPRLCRARPWGQREPKAPWLQWRRAAGVVEEREMVSWARSHYQMTMIRYQIHQSCNMCVWQYLSMWHGILNLITHIPIPHSILHSQFHKIDSS